MLVVSCNPLTFGNCFFRIEFTALICLSLSHSQPDKIFLSSIVSPKFGFQNSALLLSLPELRLSSENGMPDLFLFGSFRDKHLRFVDSAGKVSFAY